MISSGVTSTHPLHSLSRKMTIFLLDSKSTNTNKSYFSSFNRWSVFIKKHGYNNLPADPIHIALYITHLIDRQMCSPNVINNAIYAIKWAPVLNGFSDPTENSFILSLQESAKRLNGKPVNTKDPITRQMIIKLCSQFKDSDDLMIKLYRISSF